MILTSLGPCLPGAALAGEPLVYVAFVQAPLYLVAMTAAAFKLNGMLVATMQAERDNDHRARHDALTGLSNRVELLDAIDARLKAAPNSEHALALLFLDLDGFKTVNDTYGHAAGDRLLKMVADRLRCALPTTDVAARIGGDEFVVLAADLTHEQAIDLGQRLIAAVATSYDLGDGMSAAIGVSVGIAMAPEHGGNLADLLGVADAALYQAKSSGKLRCRMASPMALRRPQGESTVAVQIGVAA
jgi:diguanylate cyclase (GGDEF)-like protein